MNTKVKVGIVGLGRIFDLNCKGYLDAENAEVVALCENNKESLEKRGLIFPSARKYESFEDFLQEDLDIVEILTPHIVHKDMVIKSLKSGKNVSVQKPMAMNVKEAELMVATAKEENKILKVFENFIFYPPLVKAKALLDDGYIGKPIHFRIQFISGYSQYAWNVPVQTSKWRTELFKQKKAGPLVFDDGHHLLAVALWLFGDPNEVFCTIDSTEEKSGKVYDAPATIVWKHKNPKVHGVCTFSRSEKFLMNSKYYACNEKFEIIGEKGIIIVNRASGKFINEPVIRIYKDGKIEDFHDIEDDWGKSFYYSTRNFLDFFSGKTNKYELTGEQGLEVMKFLDMVQESSITKKAVVQ